MSLGQDEEGNKLQCALITKDLFRISRMNGLSELEITFYRTLRLPEEDERPELPPCFGELSLFPVEHHADRLPADTVAKGGLLLPLYQHEAAWVRFESSSRFAVKIYVDRINVITGKPVNEDGAMELWGAAALSDERDSQDYLVVPDQQWLDGACCAPGKSRQFTAAPFEAWYSMDAQLTTQDIVGGCLQFDVWPTEPLPETPSTRLLLIKLPSGRRFEMAIDEDCTVMFLKCLIRDREGIPTDRQQLLYDAQPLRDVELLANCGIPKVCKLNLRIRPLTTNPPQDRTAQQAVAPRGRPVQNLVRDVHPAATWDRSNSLSFNVTIINSAVFRHVAGGRAPPTSYIDSLVYGAHAVPFLEHYEEPQLTREVVAKERQQQQQQRQPLPRGKRGGKKGAKVQERVPVVQEHQAVKLGHVRLNPNGPLSPLKPVSEMQEDV